MISMMALPVAAHAGSSWSAVTVTQSQSANSPHHTVDMQQSATISTATWVGGQVAASSEVSGSQEQEFKGHGSQSQELVSASAVEWNDHQWPSQTTAHSVGSVDQSQDAWSKKPIMQEQSGHVSLDTKVDGDHSKSDTWVDQQNNGAKGDAHQDQFLGAEAKSEGWMKWPWGHDKSWCWSGCDHSIGGQIVQRITVVVDNIIDF